MVTRADWMPYRIDERLELVRLVAAKIDGYSAVLGLTLAQIDRIKAIAVEFGFAFTLVEQSRATNKALRSWRDSVLSNLPSNTVAPQRPMFDNTAAPAGMKLGLIAEFRKLAEIIKASPGFTAAIGDDLQIMSPQHAARNLAEIVPEPKIAIGAHYTVRVGGSLQGMSAMRVEYQRKGETEWRIVAFLTHLPAEIDIEPAAQGDPETGLIRCILLKRNEQVGQYSASYPVTISAH